MCSTVCKHYQAERAVSGYDDRPAFESVCRYGHADSSPMAGYDWLWSQYMEINTSLVVTTYTAITKVQTAMLTWTAELDALGDEAWANC